MAVSSRTLRNAYQDSVKLMRAASDVEAEYAVSEAFAVMATEENKRLVIEAGLLKADELDSLGPNDLLLVVEAGEESTAEEAVAALESGVRGSRSAEGSEAGGAPPPRSLYGALATLDDPDLALISVPGEYADREAWKALNEGLHVHVFSDNVPVDEERALKEFGREEDLLVMGPDCGTAILNGVPLGFANAVDRGSVGAVAASGTGLQEVTSLLDRAGTGVSQAIGTGGRDLSAEVGGLGMLGGLERLSRDPDTEVIVLISKPPAESTLGPLLEAVEECEKPVVAQFIGAEADAIEASGAMAADTLADAARLAAEAQPGADAHVSFEGDLEGFVGPGDASAIAEALGERAADRFAVRGLFTGGTFTDEAAHLLAPTLGGIASNVGTGDVLKDPLAPRGHAVVDLGADAFTRGRPHPMIDPALRTEQLRATLDDDEVLVILLDVVLGYGAHEDPASPIVQAVEGHEGWPAVVASVCGTHGDPQGWARQVENLREAGVHVAVSNADAARLAGALQEVAAAAGGGV